MADSKAHIRATIESLTKEVEEHLQAAADTKKLVNALARRLGDPEPYEVVDDAGGKRTFVPRVDQFANEPAPSTAVRSFLEARGQQAGAATFDEIYAALKAGGFAWSGRDDEKSKNGLRVAIGKDAKLVRIGENAVGLTEWYPRRPKTERGGKERPGQEENEKEPDEAPPVNVEDLK
jgi:hypothetical protein